MKVLIVSGIWPPDVGGPASHAPELAGFLSARGHRVEVVTTASASPEPAPWAVHWTSRRLPVGIRHLHSVGLIRRRAVEADVVYATSMLTRAAAGAALARRPLVVKLTGDPAFERARRWGLYSGDLARFEQDGDGVRVRGLKAVRRLSVGRAAHVVCPSEYLRVLALEWGLAAARVSVLPNPTPHASGLAGRDELRERLGLNGATLAFAGRLTAAKSLELALEAVAANDGVSLVLAGEGDERPRLERRARELGLDGRVRFLGAQPRERVLELFRAADASILSSSWENFPHTVVEALAVGTPVISTRAGGVAEVVRDGENGLLVPVDDARALGEAIGRFFADDALRTRLAEAAAPSVADHAPERVYGELERILAAAAP